MDDTDHPVRHGLDWRVVDPHNTRVGEGSVERAGHTCRLSIGRRAQDQQFGVVDRFRAFCLHDLDAQLGRQGWCVDVVDLRTFRMFKKPFQDGAGDRVTR